VLNKIIKTQWRLGISITIVKPIYFLINVSSFDPWPTKKPPWCTSIMNRSLSGPALQHQNTIAQFRPKTTLKSMPYLNPSYKECKFRHHTTRTSMPIPRTSTTTQEFGFDSLTIDGRRFPFATHGWSHLGIHRDRRPTYASLLVLDPTPPLLPPAASPIAFATRRRRRRRRDGPFSPLPREELEETKGK
jgi:hypothetical protein